MTLAPGGPDARSLVMTGKAAAPDGVAVLTLARRCGRRPPDETPGPASTRCCARDTSMGS
jgi:hypothetical protein